MTAITDQRNTAPTKSGDIFPLFKGATRVPTIAGGVPTRPFIALVMVGAGLGMLSLYAWALIPALYPLMAIVAREDDRAFRIIELWLRTRATNRHQRFWNGSSYTLLAYPRRPWTKAQGIER
ncbi:type IV secretion system protein VirB3 [Bordetella ansorpii]|uniref:Type IV secretion system protein VirB3 n=1 Tax=Bordetella ansorpii TaxID=288768 RepID=A0A157QL74_9BORD|nr:VirB3 family type IV secretion system protein [Bordetella ansorpii]SAI46507.1 type IV secretion system protein VirB3 [Bordetella ansorpii]